MIRTITACLLLLGAGQAAAEQLYRWVEADGSITFSPSPPASGIPFDTVGGSGVGASSGVSQSLAEPAATTAVSSVDAVPAMRPIGPAVATTRSPERVEPLSELPAARLAYAPAVQQPSIADTAPQTAMAALNTSEQSRPVRPAARTIQPHAATQKRQHCQDLSKRVTSLERRLRAGLTPEDMDNTVIHMARYQRNFDQFCTD